MIKVYISGAIIDLSYIDNFIKALSNYCARLCSSYEIKIYALPVIINDTLAGGTNFAVGIQGQISDVMYLDNFASSVRKRLERLCSTSNVYIEVVYTFTGP